MNEEQKKEELKKLQQEIQDTINTLIIKLKTVERTEQIDEVINNLELVLERNSMREEFLTAKEHETYYGSSDYYWS